MLKLFQIAMDGPAGAGKSTIAKAVAKKLGFTFINSGGMYRCIAIALKNTNLEDEHAIKQILKEITVTQQGDTLLLNDNDVTKECYTPTIANLVPLVSKIPFVRERCHDFQLQLANGVNIVIEGRDTTTVMFPNATLKVFVTADSSLRATRRWEQTGKQHKYDDILADLVARDKADTERKVSPLKKAHDAFVLDTTNLDENEAIDIVIAEFHKRAGCGW